MTDGGRQRVAVIGIAGRFPGAADVAVLWENLLKGRDTITRDGAGVRRGDLVYACGLLEDAELFDAALFRMTPREAELTHPQHRVFLECAWQGLVDAGIVAGGSALRVGVFGSCSDVPRAGAEDDLDPVNVGSVADFLATRVAYKLNLTGPAVTVQTSCSASLTAVHLACRSVLDGDCDVAVAGGVSITSLDLRPYRFEEGGVLSPDGTCRAFDEAAAGTVPGNGAGVVVLRELDAALKAGDHVHAVIAGSAINNDGSSKVGFAAPGIAGQADVLARALRNADADPGSIAFVEAHGTGTPMGDPIEVTALKRVYGNEGGLPCALGSIKTNIGHLDAAAGIAGLIKAVLAVEHGEIPPTAGFARPHPALGLDDTRFFVNDVAVGWPERGPRRAAVSSFGVGGTNAHVVVDEAPSRTTDGRRLAANVVTLAAPSRAALARYRDQLVGHSVRRGLDRDELCHSLQTGRPRYVNRTFRVVRSLDELLEWEDVDSREAGTAGVVLVFSGQGGQRVGIARDLLEADAVFRNRFESCARVVEESVGVRVGDILYPAEGSLEEAQAMLERPVLAHLALFTLQYAVATALQDYGIRPVAMIGVSLGEYVCAAISQTMDLGDAVRIVAERARLAEGLPEGRMLVVHERPDRVEEMLPADLDLAGVMGPEGAVVAGAPADVARFEEELGRRGVESTTVRSSRAYHSRAVDRILPAFQEFLDQHSFSPPAVPYVSNVTGTWIQPSEAVDVAYWARHLRSPFRAAQGVGDVLGTGASALVEVGPSSGLAPVVRALGRGVGATPRFLSLFSTDRRDDYARFLSILGELWCEGVEVDWTKLYGGRIPGRAPLPPAPLERTEFRWAAPTVSREPSGLGRSNDPREWIYRAAWREVVDDPVPATARERAAVADGPVWVVGRSRSAETIAGAWAAEGKHVRAVDIALDGSLDDQRSAWTALLSGSDGVPAVIVDAAAADGIAAGDDDAASFYRLLALAQALSELRDADVPPVLTVTRGAHAVMGTEPVDGRAAALEPLCRVIQQEDPRLRFKVVDLGGPAGAEAGPALATRIWDEALVSERPTVVALRGSRRWTRTFAAVHPSSSGVAPPVRREGAYAVLGGLGEVGLALAEAIAVCEPADLVLMGRTPVDQSAASSPRRRIRERLAAIEAAGTRVTFVQTDCTDGASFQAAMDRAIERTGRMDGLIHAAGPDAARTFAEVRATDRAHVEHHFAAKVRGLRVLERVLTPLDLDFVVLCSSLASILGGIGYGAYAAANAFEDAEAVRMSAAGPTKWFGINWEAWRESDAVEGLPRNEVLDRLAVTTEEGKAAFLLALDCLHQGNVAISTTGLDERLEHATPRWVDREEPTPDDPPRPRSNRRLDPTEEAVADVWRRRLGVSAVDGDSNYLEIGGDSITAIQIRADLEETFGVRLPLREMLAAETPAGVAELVRDRGARRAD